MPCVHHLLVKVQTPLCVPEQLNGEEDLLGVSVCSSPLLMLLAALASMLAMAVLLVLAMAAQDDESNNHNRRECKQDSLGQPLKFAGSALDYLIDLVFLIRHVSIREWDRNTLEGIHRAFNGSSPSVAVWIFGGGSFVGEIGVLGRSPSLLTSSIASL
jgi:hypothetical protein